MKCILDTSAWYAFLSQDDEAHLEAVKIIQSRSFFYLVPFTVLEELAALVHKRKGKNASFLGIGKILTSPQVEVLFPDESDLRNIWEFYSSSPGYLDFVDSSVVWYARRFDAPVFTFDSHFRKMKIKILEEVR